jgi:4-amino-4-deoxy-L-arabinose transferase-like glycosyltransferase
MKNIPRTMRIIVALAVLVRLATLAWVLYSGDQAVLLGGDASTYAELGKNLATGHGFTTLVDGTYTEEVFRAPGFPLLLAPFMFFPWGPALWGIFLSIVAGILLPLFMWYLGTRVGGERVGLIAALFVAFEPHMVWFSWVLMSEMAATLCMLGALTLGVWAWRRQAWNYYWVTGFLAGYAGLIRPPLLPVAALVFAAASAHLFFSRRKSLAAQMVLAALVMLAVTVPWSVRNWEVTGHYAVSGMGWYNVYFDYLSSLAAVKNKTSFIAEKLEREAHPPAGVAVGQTLSPTAAPILKAAALQELSARWKEVLKLEPVFLFSYVTHDGYFQYMRSLGFIGQSGQAAASSTTFALLSQGLGGTGKLVQALREQYFLPLLGRAFTATLALLALWGVYIKRKDPLVLGFFFAIALSAILATAIGLGVEARSRVPMEPLIFILAAVALDRVLSMRHRGA